MNTQKLDRLVRKYYGYVVDMEGSGVEILDMLFVRDGIQDILNHSRPEDGVSPFLYERLHELDQLLWEERETLLMVLGGPELRYARAQRSSPRSHWWWYLDELSILPQPLNARAERLTVVFAQQGD